MNLQRLSKNSAPVYNLLSIREVLPNTIIAGGWIRDLYHGIPFNDIDVYVTEKDNAIENKHSIYVKEFWEDQLQLKTKGIIGCDGIISSCSLDDVYSGLNHIETVWEIQKDRITYNIIILNMNPIKYINNFFDFGICKAYCDGSKIKLTADFMHDSQHRHLTLVSKEIEEAEFYHIMDYHLPKIKDKYPGYTLIVPEMYQDWYQEFTGNNL